LSSTDQTGAIKKHLNINVMWIKPINALAAGETGVDPMTTRHITLDIPEKVLLAEKADEASFARELRLLAAVKLYELGRLSSGRAAELAGLPRVEFLLAGV
jgi:hypothetical protein